jgi:hypothetical protein
MTPASFTAQPKALALPAPSQWEPTPFLLGKATFKQLFIEQFLNTDT